MSIATEYDVAIVGGGPCSIFLLRGLISHYQSRGIADRVRIAIIEPRSSIGTGSPWCTLDTSPFISSNMHTGRLETYGSAVNFDPTNRRITEQVQEIHADHFVPRHVVGAQLAGAWESTLSKAVALGFEVRHVRHSATDLHQDGGRWTVELNDATSIKANVVVLALGLFATDRFPGMKGHQGYIADPWHSFQPVEDMRDAQVISIIGTGPTAIDWTLRIFETGFAGRIHLVSRAGRLPAARPNVASTPIEPITTRNWLIGQRERHGEFTPAVVDMVIMSVLERAQVNPSEISRWLMLYRQGGTALLDGTAEVAHSPQPMFEALKHIDHIASTIWRCSASKTKAYILQRLARLHSDFSFALPVHNAHEVLQRMQDGQLTLSRGFRTVRTRNGSFEIAGEQGSVEYAIRSDWLINATGFSGELENATNPFVRKLVERGLLRQSPHGGALIRPMRGQVLGGDGVPINGLFVAGGSLARGAAYMVNSLSDTSEQGLDVGFAVAFDLLSRDKCNVTL